MAIKHNVMIREPNQQLPEDVRQKLLSTYQVAWGFASPQEDKMVHSAIFNSGEDNLADTLAKIDEGYKADRVFYNFFDAGDDEINLESIQPFSLVDNGKEGDDGKDFVMALIEGELDPKYKGEDGELFTPEYLFVNSFLKPLVSEYYDLAGGDIKLMMGMLDKPVAENKIIAELGPRATVLIIPCTGAAKAIVKANNESGKWTWGFATRNMGISQVTATPAEAAPKASLKSALKAATAPAAATAGGTVIKPEEQYAPLLKNDKFELRAGVLWVKPPKGQGGNALPWKEAKTFWNTHSAIARPEEPVDVYAGFRFDQLRPASPIRTLKAKLMGEIEEKEQPKKADSEQGPAQPPKEKPAPMTLFIPAHDKETYLGYKTAGKIGPSTIEELVATTKEHPTASVQLGETLNDLLMGSKESYNRMPGHLRTCVMHEFRMKCLELMGRIPKAEEKPTEKPAEAAPIVNPNEAKPKMGLKAGLKIKAA